MHSGSKGLFSPHLQHRPSLCKRKTVKLKELANESFAMREKGSGTRELFERYMIDSGIEIKIAFEGNSPEAIKKR